MRILHIDTGKEMRGGQYQVLLLLKALRDRGEESILLARQGSPLLHTAEAAGFAVYLSGAAQVWKYSGSVDIVHAHDARAHTLAVVASRRKFVVSRRVAFPVKRSMVSRWKYQRAARFLAISHFVAKELKAADISGEKIDVVYDAVDNVTPVTEWTPDFPAVALASDDPKKGRDLVEQAAQLSGIPVVFSTDLQADLRCASLFVYISRSEGLGSAALLAMRMGVPVIASAVEGLTEVFEDGVSGVFVSNDAQGIAAAMKRLRNDRIRAQQLIEGGKRRIQERFTVERLVQGTLGSYRRALDA